MWDSKTLEQFDKWDKSRPSTTAHGVTSDNINEHMKELKPTQWRLEGNKLIGMTSMGPLVQTIPTDYVLTGKDDNNLPIFTKVQIQ